MIYAKDDKVVDRALRSTYFEDLDEIGRAYELESRKPPILIRRPFQVGIAVYQLAKLKMLEFYYDLDRYVDRRDFELIQMDTDSNYMVISGDKLEDIIHSERRAMEPGTKTSFHSAWVRGVGFRTVKSDSLDGVRHLHGISCLFFVCWAEVLLNRHCINNFQNIFLIKRLRRKIFCNGRR